MKKIFWILCPLVLSLAACKDKSSSDVTIEPVSFSCTPGAYELSTKGGDFTVSIKAEGSWWVENTSKTWVTVEPAEGYGNESDVWVTVAAGSADSAKVVFMDTEGHRATLLIGRGKSVTVSGEEKYPGGQLIGDFSVSSSRKVNFSQGNLQFNAATGIHSTVIGDKPGTWRFAYNQWDVIGDDNKNVSETYAGWIDLFAWATSGWDNTLVDRYAANFEPWSSSDTVMFTEENTYGYGPSLSRGNMSLTGAMQYYDWGRFNAISNGGNTVNYWRTLTADEWRYLLFGRSNAEKLRGQATLMKVHGYVLFPDGTDVESLGFVSNPNDWVSNIYSTESDWEMLESMGAVFLPCAGRRYGTEVENTTTWGIYWSSTAEDMANAIGVGFFEGFGFSYIQYLRYRAFSVRLVHNI